ncbi:MAG: hypothetical protein JNL61_04880 [Rhizobiaceae bacterium]|nr:hypothetical protein [Rhizobiaceae bacterium]
MAAYSAKCHMLRCTKLNRAPATVFFAARRVNTYAASTTPRQLTAGAVFL